jgi:hypothetical protein
MGIQFFKKKFRKTSKIIKSVENTEKDEAQYIKNITETKNNKKKKQDDMLSKDKISEIENTLNNMAPEVKVIKKDKGLIERTESSKIIVTEDNRQVLND